MNPKLVFLVGPTASGKTELAIALAEKFNFEIINCDSLLLYKYLNIGTAKPSCEIQEKIPHHLIDVFSPDEIFTANDYVLLAKRKIVEITSRGKNCLFVGAAGFYIRALLDGMYETAVQNGEIKKQLMQELETQGLPHLYEKLKRIDPHTTLHPNNRYRIIRALEVFELTGKTMTQIQNEFQKKSEYDALFIGPYFEKSDLHLRIKQRTDKMLEGGLLDEVSEILKRYDKTCKPLGSIGYKEAIAYLENKIDYDTMVESINQGTKQLAKRQQTWFKKYHPVHWIGNEDSAGKIITEFYGNNIRV